jgi:hypothetical protein
LIDMSQGQQQQQPRFSSAPYPQVATYYVTASQNPSNNRAQSQNNQSRFINETNCLFILSLHFSDRQLENRYQSRGSTVSQAPLLSQTIAYLPTQNHTSRSIDNAFGDLNATVPARTTTSSYTASWDPQSMRRSTSNVQSTSVFGPNPFSTTNSQSAAQRPPVPQQPSPEASPRRNYVTSTNAARSLEGDDRPIFGGSGGGGGGAGRGRGRFPTFPPIQEHEPLSNSTQRQRRGTFALDEPSLPNLPQSGAQRPRDTVIVQELYNVRRRKRAKTPVAFTVNLNEQPQSRASGIIESSTV